MTVTDASDRTTRETDPRGLIQLLLFTHEIVGSLNKTAEDDKTIRLITEDKKNT